MDKKRAFLSAALIGGGILICWFGGQIPESAAAVQCATLWTVLLILMPLLLLIAALLFPDLFPGV